MAGKRWTGSEWTDFTIRRRWNGSQWIKMAGYRWDGVDWVELWPPPGSLPVTLTPLWFNLDEATQPLTGAFNLIKDLQ